MSALDPLNNLVAWVIMRIHAVLGSLFGPGTGLAWGLSIVFLVMLIRLCLVPLFIKQVHAQRKMAQHAPQLQELRKKYKGDKQRLNPPLVGRGDDRPDIAGSQTGASHLAVLGDSLLLRLLKSGLD